MLLKNGSVYDNGDLHPMDIIIEDGIVVARGESLASDNVGRVVDLTGLVVFPGFVDVHVHLREPGFSYK